MPQLHSQQRATTSQEINTPYENISDYDDSSEWPNSPDSYIEHTPHIATEDYIKCKNAENCLFKWHDSASIDGGIYGFDLKSDEYYLDSEMYHDFLNQIHREGALTTIISFSADYKGVGIDLEMSYLTIYLEPLLRKQSVTKYIAVWETGENSYNHIHVLLQTTRRADKLRKALETSHRQLNMDYRVNTTLAQMKKIKNIKSTWAYFMKNPTRIMSNSETMLQMAWLHISTGYEKWIENPEGKGTVTQRCANLITYLMNKHKVYSLEELARVAQEELLPYVSLGCLQHIINNCRSILQCVPQQDLIELALSTLTDTDTDINLNTVRKYLIYQNIDPEAFGLSLIQWLQRRGKRNTIVIEGPPDTGKSTFIRALLSPIYRVGEITHSGDFMYTSCVNKDIIQWEEPCITSDKVEKFKTITEGQATMIQIKHKENTQLRRTPIIITTNNPVWKYCSSAETALRARMHIIHFEKSAKNFPTWVKLTAEKETPKQTHKAKPSTDTTPTITTPVNERRLQDSTLRIHYRDNTRIPSVYLDKSEATDNTRSNITTTDWQRFIHYMYNKYSDTETI